MPKQRYALAEMADHLASKGRLGDSMLVHMNPYEVSALAKLPGGLTVNPDTGLPEAFLPFLLPLLGNLGLTALAPALGISGALGTAALGGVGSALGSKIAGGSWGDALTSGLMGGVGSYMGGAGKPPAGVPLGTTALPDLTLPELAPLGTQAGASVLPEAAVNIPDLLPAVSPTLSPPGTFDSVKSFGRAAMKPSALIPAAVSAGMTAETKAGKRKGEEDEEYYIPEQFPEQYRSALPFGSGYRPGFGPEQVLIEMIDNPDFDPTTRPGPRFAEGGEVDGGHRKSGATRFLSKISPAFALVSGQGLESWQDPLGIFGDSRSREERDRKYHLDKEGAGQQFAAGGLASLGRHLSAGIPTTNGGMGEIQSTTNGGAGPETPTINGGNFRPMGGAVPYAAGGYIGGVTLGRQATEPQARSGVMPGPNPSVQANMAALNLSGITPYGGGFPGGGYMGQNAPATPRPRNIVQRDPMSFISDVDWVSDVQTNDLGIPTAPIEAGFNKGGLAKIAAYKEGGSVKDSPRYKRALQAIRTEAVAALQGQHPKPRAALNRYAKAFGPKALQALAQQVQGAGDGRQVRGPGGGQDDAIPASIDGQQPAALSDGEFVMPADVVSHLGDGSSDEGARRLTEMMERVRQRKGAKTGLPKKIKAEQVMPA